MDISKKDFGTLCICAIRYCLGRRTYMPSAVQRIILEHLDDINGIDLAIIADEQNTQRRFVNLWGDDCDKKDWLKFYERLQEYRESKE